MSWYNGSYSILVPVGEESEFATAIQKYSHHA
jgi:hypothetical protein